MRLPGTSDVVYNLGGYYEKYGLSLRLQYQRRTDWLDTIADDLTDAGDTYWAADDELDFSARYAVNRNFEIYFDASNLLNKPGRRYSAGQPADRHRHPDRDERPQRSSGSGSGAATPAASG